VDQLGKWWEDWPLVIGMDDDEIRKIDGGSIGHFLNGLFDVEIKTPEHSFNTSWMVFSEGSLVDVIPGDDQYPYYQEGILRAFIDEDKLYIYNDCSDSKGVSSCDQIFTGILNNGLVSGEFMIDGRKSGTWTMRPSGKIKTQDFGETINPIADSHIYQYTYSNWNKASWGGYDKLGVGYHPSGGEKRAYLKFDIGNVQPNDIGKTTLKLYQYHTSGSTDLKLGIYEVTENWNEGRGLYKPQTLATGNEICWINQPDFETTLLSSFSPGSSINQWVEVDVTELVRNWAAGMPNNGLMIKGIGSFSGMGESMYGFYSREWEDQSLRPQLIITPMRKEGDVVTSDYDSEPISSMTKEVAGVLDGLRWELPCNGTGNTCGAKVQRPSETAILGGDPNQLYEVTLRFRGVVEYHSYSGGQQDGLWYIGGKSNQGSFNIYQLQTTDPVQTFFLNAEKSGIYRCWPIDYTRKIKVKGGSKVILSANAQDGALIGNHDGKGKPIIIPGIAPAPEPFNGQFIQMDVLSVVPVSVN
ncbi:MAG: DNRLRE domain-containing protein, partial [Saprospiraceae bacterium]|nr:DNRLRE domain-containing protein [Saprospiraceae bacterium]